jgi:hypothetical protein
LFPPFVSDGDEKFVLGQSGNLMVDCLKNNFRAPQTANFITQKSINILSMML